MDHEDRPEGRLPSHTGLRQPLEILPPCSSRSSLSVPCPPVWALDSSSGIHQDVGSCGPAVAHSGRPCPILTWTIELCVRILKTESGTYTTNFSTSSVFGLNNQLKQVNVTTLTHSGLSGFKFQPGTSPYFSYGLFLTSSHQCPIPSVSINGHSCSLNFILQQDVTFCPVLTQWPSSPTLSPVLVQSQVVSPSVVVGYTNPVGCGLPYLPSLVSQMKCDDRHSVTSSRTQPFLLYGYIPDGMERQLDRPSDIRTMAAPESQLGYFIGDFSSAVNLWASIAKTVQQ